MSFSSISPLSSSNSSLANSPSLNRKQFSLEVKGDRTDLELETIQRIYSYIRDWIGINNGGYFVPEKSFLSLKDTTTIASKLEALSAEKDKKTLSWSFKDFQFDNPPEGTFSLTFNPETNTHLFALKITASPPSCNTMVINYCLAEIATYFHLPPPELKK